MLQYPLLENKVALITGAKGGLGNHVTDAFLRSGAKVAGVSRSIQAADLPSPNFVGVPAELSALAAAQGVVNIAIERFGRIDILVHLVGGFAGGPTVAESDYVTLETMLNVNFRCA